MLGCSVALPQLKPSPRGAGTAIKPDSIDLDVGARHPLPSLLWVQEWGSLGGQECKDESQELSLGVEN